ncbi:unnamed protein product [Linum trigynum]|uniref:Uncharacterized protein n=1 Tax=Linum trigynum TaxID=586398 RepID=A0AAV2ET41_9ROSI
MALRPTKNVHASNFVSKEHNVGTGVPVAKGTPQLSNIARIASQARNPAEGALTIVDVPIREARLGELNGSRKTTPVQTNA